MMIQTSLDPGTLPQRLHPKENQYIKEDQMFFTELTKLSLCKLFRNTYFSIESNNCSSTKGFEQVNNWTAALTGLIFLISDVRAENGSDLLRSLCWSRSDICTVQCTGPFFLVKAGYLYDL